MQSFFQIPETPVRMIEIGYGLCRGPEWQSGKWPIVKGSISAQDCANACAAKKGCTAFDLSNKVKKKFNCHLYGKYYLKVDAKKFQNTFYYSNIYTRIFTFLINFSKNSHFQLSIQLL